MALVVADFVKETSATTGTGTYTLAGAVTGFQSFAIIGNGNTTYYSATDGTSWEVGIGTYTSAGTTLARTTIIKSSNANAAVNWTTTVTLSSAGPASKFPLFDATGQLILPAGTTSLAPLIQQAGTLNTTAQVGAEEFDGTVFYDSIAASTRTSRVDAQWTLLNAAYTLTSQTAAQKLFNASTSGAVTLPVGLYRFRCFFTLTSMTGPTTAFGFALGGAATFTQGWLANALKCSSLTSTSNAYAVTYNTTANTGIVTGDANTNGIAYIQGWLKVTGSGTVIPQVSLGAASAAVVGAGSFFEVWALSKTATTALVGNWS